MSFTYNPLSIFYSSSEVKLSVSVAEVVVILVGLLINGYIPRQYKTSRISILLIRYTIGSMNFEICLFDVRTLRRNCMLNISKGVLVAFILIVCYTLTIDALLF